MIYILVMLITLGEHDLRIGSERVETEARCEERRNELLAKQDRRKVEHGQIKLMCVPMATTARPA